MDVELMRKTEKRGFLKRPCPACGQYMVVARSDKTCVNCYGLGPARKRLGMSRETRSDLWDITPMLVMLLLLALAVVYVVVRDAGEPEVADPAPQSIVPYTSEGTAARYTRLAGPVRTAVWGRLNEANWTLQDLMTSGSDPGSEAAVEPEVAGAAALGDPISDSTTVAERPAADSSTQEAPEVTRGASEPPAATYEVSGTLTGAEVGAAARAAGWAEGLIAKVVSVVKCESQNRANAVGAQGEVGLAQIHPIHRRLHAIYNLFDPVQNLKAALEIFKGSGWGAWSCA